MNNKTIKLYSTVTCPYCVMEKRWLDANNIKHEVVYVDKNQEEAIKMVKNTGQFGVPVTEIADENGKVEYIIGFDQFTLKKILEI